MTAPITLPKTPDAANIINFLWQRVDTDTATDQELEWLAGAAEISEWMARGLGETLSNVACLVDEDTSALGFAKNDFSSLLHRAADTMSTVAMLTYIGGEAGYELRRRRSLVQADKA